MQHGFVFSFDEIADMPLVQLRDTLRRSQSRPLSELRLFDLVEVDGGPLRTGNGVYVFHGHLKTESDVNVLYVGKSESRSFLERIPAHFDPRDSATHVKLNPRPSVICTTIFPLVDDAVPANDPS
jgi:hypothetical protein